MSISSMDDLVAVCCLQDLSRASPKSGTNTRLVELTDGSKNSPQRRSRVPMACTRCKLAHTRCDTKRPCGRCLRRGDICVDAIPKRRGRKRSEDSDSMAVPKRQVRMRRRTLCASDPMRAGERQQPDPEFETPTDDLYSSTWQPSDTSVTQSSDKNKSNVNINDRDTLRPEL